jgi:hypothetical protein
MSCGPAAFPGDVHVLLDHDAAAGSRGSGWAQGRPGGDDGDRVGAAAAAIRRAAGARRDCGTVVLAVDADGVRDGCWAAPVAVGGTTAGTGRATRRRERRLRQGPATVLRIFVHVSENRDGRRTRRWWATARAAPQYRVHITAIPAAGGGWIVRLHRLLDVCEAYEAHCANGWEAAQEVWEIMAALDIQGEWTTSIDRPPGAQHEGP